MTVFYDLTKDFPVNMIAILSFNGTFLLGGERTGYATELKGDEFFTYDFPLVGFWTR